MPEERTQTSDVAGKTLDIEQSDAVSGGGDTVSPVDGPNLVPLYDALVDATSQLIERVMTAAKPK